MHLELPWERAVRCICGFLVSVQEGREKNLAKIDGLVEIPGFVEDDQYKWKVVQFDWP